MDDEMIVSMYWDRNEQAVAETAKKYGSYCRSIAHNILSDPSDEEECVNDTWLRAWNAIPPQRPTVLSVFLGKITRNLSFDMYRKKHREKRREKSKEKKKKGNELLRENRCFTTGRSMFFP